MFRERDNFEQLSENVKYGHLKKYMVIYHKEGKRVTIGLFLMVILSNKIVQDYHKSYPQKGVRVNDSVIMESG